VLCAPQPFVIRDSQCSKKDGRKAEYENRYLMTEKAGTFGLWLSSRLESEDAFRMRVDLSVVNNGGDEPKVNRNIAKV
jgi:hypothetical protein